MTSSLRVEWPNLLSELHAATHPYWLQHHRARRLERARRLIEAEYGGALDLDRLSKAACFSRYHFVRSFRRQYGETPHRYLVRRRIERAKALLLETNQSITEVGFYVGFETSAAFSRAFSQEVGCSPTQHRRRLVQVNWCPPPLVPWCFQRHWR